MPHAFRSGVFALAVVLLCVGAPVSVRAQIPSELLDTPPDSLLADFIRSMPGEGLALEGAVERALEQSPEARAARARLEEAIGRVRREKGTFDPEIFAGIELRDDETPSASVFAGADILESQTTTTSVGARTRLTLGTELEARVQSEKSESNNALASLDPQYVTTGQIDVRQPLLRGFGPATRGALSAAEHQLEAERLREQQSRRAVRAETERAYWELHAAERDFAVQQLVSEQADLVLEQARLRAEAGIIGPNQVANARVFVSQQRLALLDREEALGAASDRLVELTGLRPTAGRNLRTLDSPPSDQDVFRGVPTTGMGTEAEPFVEQAVQYNLEVRAAQHDLYAFEELVSAAKWDALPQLDLVGSIGGNGLSGTGQTVIFGADTLRTSADGGAGDALRQSLGLDHPVWSIGLELNIPLGLREGRGARDERRAAATQQAETARQIQLAKESEVRDALRRLLHGQERLELAREGVDAASEQIRIGLIEFENGRTTAFELVRLGADFAVSQQELSRALVRTATARADLERLVDGLNPAGSGEDE